MSKGYLTQEGLKKLQEELEQLKNVRRKELAEQLERALSFGDISENAEFQEAKEEQAFVEGRILELQDILRTAKVFSPKTSSGVVQIGSTVLVSSGRAKEKFYIVGDQEANPMEGKISVDSPLGQSILSQSKGAVVTVYTPEGKRTYRILEIA